jgi:heat shock protein HslJ
MKTALTLSLILLITTIIGLTACGATVTALGNKKWVLESYGEQGDLQSILESTEITAVFESAERHIRGSAGCNTYFAGYKVKGNKLSISDIANTEMYCMEPEGVMEQEKKYLTLLLHAATFEVEDDQLMIFTSDNKVFIFSTQ